MNSITLHIISLILTIFVEFLIYYVCIKKNTTKLLLNSLLINSITLPIAVNFYLNVINNFFLIEGVVFLTESFLIMWLMKLKYKNSLLISILANFATSALSLLHIV